MRKIIAVLLIVFITAYFSPNTVSLINSILLTESSVSADTDGNAPSETAVKPGDYVYFGNYLDEPILWKAVKETEDGKILLISEHIICFKAFDASGTDSEYHTTQDVRKYGSADWDTCTLKEWLNSSEETVAYSHCPPNSGGVFNGANAYDSEAGFLHENNFTVSQRELISDDGVFLPEKSILRKVFDTEELKKHCTASALLSDESGYVITPNKAVWYWTSTALGSNNVSVAAVTSAGTFYKSLAYDSAMGVCPALYLETNKVMTNGGTGSGNEPLIITGAVK